MTEVSMGGREGHGVRKIRGGKGQQQSTNHKARESRTFQQKCSINETKLIFKRGMRAFLPHAIKYYMPLKCV